MRRPPARPARDIPHSYEDKADVRSIVREEIDKALGERKQQIPESSSILPARRGSGLNKLATVLRKEALPEVIGAQFPETFIRSSDSNDTAGLQRFFDYMFANGGTGILPRWYNVTASIEVEGGTDLGVRIYGIGRYVSGIRKSVAFDGSMLRLNANNFALAHFGIIARRSILGGASGHGLRIFDSANVDIDDLYVADYTDTGIILFSDDIAASRVNAHVRRCHVNGTNGCGNGILLTDYDHSSIERCYVENVNTLSPCRALQFKACSNSQISASSARNCFNGMAITKNDEATPSSNCHAIGVSVSAPHAVGGVGVSPSGCYLGDSYNTRIEGLSVDGATADAPNGLASFNAIFNDNDVGGATVSMTAINCAGADSRVVYHDEDTRYSEITLEMMQNVTSTPIYFALNSNRNVVLLGQKIDAVIRSPWMLAENDSAQRGNRVKALSGDDYVTFTLADDTIWSATIDDAQIGLLEVFTNSADELFIGWIRISSSPAIQAVNAGSDIATGTGSLTDGTSDGTDGKLNINVGEGKLYIKNRMAGNRTVTFRLVMS